MAFPFSRSQVVTDGNVADATATINLPATRQAGDILFVVFRCAVAGAVGWPANWQELFDASADGADDQMAAAWKKVDGTEGSTIDLTNGNGKFAAIAYCIAGAIDPAVQPPELSTVATGASTTPNATTCTPTGGAKDYLWLTFTGREGEATLPPTYPTNYSVAQLTATSGSGAAVTTNVRVSGAIRTDNNAASEDAGDWTFSDSEDWTAYTIAFHPGVPVASPGRANGIGRVAQRTIRRHAVTVASLGLMSLLVQSLPPGQQLQGRPPAPRRVVVSTETRPGIAVAAVVQPPGQRLQGKPPTRARVAVSTETRPGMSLAVSAPLGQQLQGRPVRRRSRGVFIESRPVLDILASPFIPVQQPRPPRPARRSNIIAVSPPQPAAQEQLPPGRTSLARVATYKRPRPWAISPSQPVSQQPLPPGHQSFARVPTFERPRGWSVSPAQPIVAAQPLPPGRASIQSPAVRPRRVVVSSETRPAPPAVAAVFPPGQRFIGWRTPRLRDRKTWIDWRAFLVVTPLPPGETSVSRPPTRVARRTWAVSPRQPVSAQPIPPGKTSIARVPMYERLRSWALSPRQPEPQPLPPGRQSFARVAAHERTQPWAITPSQPIAPQPLPPGQRSFGRVATYGRTQPWALSPAQPVTAQPLPPGETSIGRIARHERARPWTVSPSQPVTAQPLPPGDISLAQPSRRAVRRSWVVTAQAPIAAVLPPGAQSITRPPSLRRQAPRRVTWIVATMPPPPTPMPVGQTSIRKPPRRPSQAQRHAFKPSQSSPLPTGGALGHNNIQPSIVVYIWRRIA